MKQSLLRIVFIILLSNLFLSASWGSEEETLGFKRGCVGNFLSAVKTAHQTPKGPFKKVIFSKKVDAKLIANFDKLGALSKEVKGGSAPSAETVKKITAVLDDAVKITDEVAPKEMALCQNWMSSMLAEVKNVCPNFAQDMKSEEKKNKCFELANSLPVVKAKNDLWMSALAKLFMAEAEKR
jgi:hypothetical protein